MSILNSTYAPYVTILLAVIVVALIGKFLLNFDLSKIISLIFNTILGFVVIWLINLTGLVSIPLNILTAVVVGIFGIPGALVLIILTYLNII